MRAEAWGVDDILRVHTPPGLVSGTTHRWISARMITGVASAFFFSGQNAMESSSNFGSPARLTRTALLANFGVYGLASHVLFHYANPAHKLRPRGAASNPALSLPKSETVLTASQAECISQRHESSLSDRAVTL